MSRLRFSLASLLAFTLFVAFICAALRYGTDLWASAAVSLTAALLLLSVLAAILRPAARPFWTGFALFGLAYFYASVGPGSATLQPRLITSHLLQNLEDQSEQTARTDKATLLALYRLSFANSAIASPLPAPSNIQAIGHSGFAILIGLAGGIAGYAIHGRTRHSDPQGGTT